MIRLTGLLICANEEERRTFQSHLPEHIRLTRSEPGCVTFRVDAMDDPCVYAVFEEFTTQEAFDEHQNRARTSQWGKETAFIERRYTVTTHP